MLIVVRTCFSGWFRRRLDCRNIVGQFFIVLKGEVYMVDAVVYREPVAQADLLYRRGQHIMYKGEDAQVLEVKPVFTIRISGRSHVICGNIFNDVKPSAGDND